MGLHKPRQEKTTGPNKTRQDKTTGPNKKRLDTQQDKTRHTGDTHKTHTRHGKTTQKNKTQQEWSKKNDCLCGQKSSRPSFTASLFFFCFDSQPNFPPTPDSVFYLL
jgi:hypothetical protein